MYIAVPTTWPSSLKCRAVTIVASGDVFEADGHAGGRPKVAQAGKFLENLALEVAARAMAHGQRPVPESSDFQAGKPSPITASSKSWARPDKVPALGRLCLRRAPPGATAGTVKPGARQGVSSNLRAG